MLRIEQSYNIKKYEKTMAANDFYENYVNFNETIESCKSCESYGNNWSCPPFNYDITNIWKNFEKINLILTQLHFDDFITQNTHSKEDIDTILHLTLFNEKRKLLQRLQKELRENEEIDNYMILSTGYCNICPECSKIKNNPCRYPNNKLYSIESIGGLVTKTTEEIFNTEVKWIDMENGKIPEHLTILMGVLY
jgi:predicted metal-binding protein